MGGPSSRRPRSPRRDSEIFWSIYRISDWATQRPGYPVPKTHVEREALNTPRHLQPQRSTRRRSEAESSAIHPMPVEELECVRMGRKPVRRRGGSAPRSLDGSRSGTRARERSCSRHKSGRGRTRGAWTIHRSEGEGKKEAARCPRPPDSTQPQPDRRVRFAGGQLEAALRP